MVLTYIRLNDLQNAWIPTDIGSDHSEVKDADRCCTSCVSYAYIGGASKGVIINMIIFKLCTLENVQNNYSSMHYI